MLRAIRQVALFRPAASVPVAHLASKNLLRTPIAVRMASSQPVLTEATINQKLVKAEYAVRGELIIKAEALAKRIGQDASIPFKEIIPCNIGNPQDLGQKPITFFRQVLALCHYPALMSDPVASQAFPADAIERAQKYLGAVRGGTGAYTASQGIKLIRDDVAAFISARDGTPASPDDIFLTDGASSGVKMALQTIINDEKDGVMVPIPQYPLYSATLALQGGNMINYELDEKSHWGLPMEQLVNGLKKARDQGIKVRALVIINPGNPTGQCLSADNIKEIIEFCHKERIVLLADEVYQTNIYSTVPFTSFKKVLRSMGPEYQDQELFSFHSVSKGFLGECGQRGGYMEVINVQPDVMKHLYKLASISLCSNTSGQIMTGLMVNPPAPGSPSYDLYASERDSQLESLRRRAVQVAERMNKISGVSCQSVQGAMYAFPQIKLSDKAIAAAKAAGKAPDTFYALELLQATGIVVVPGTGFGQAANTWHFRTTILPPDEMMNTMLDQFEKFHRDFTAKYA